ncbi:hypothetical protein AMJ39_06235 [candidate division TA06 bacterium DG_24]|uniref:Lipopolysaccharide heptosyltransferase II n=2 Tax=Bacteria division TA06 TaxID=1156500 RepID=A0A0S8JLD6_UNCT6|nr:MAG: hypothetical protein AMJ39_06235 [candidate division TA06 bacterium DG_24]KPL10178.1 MAG: hypothetical protein AMJ71_04125 [candidate division TA06 bacterium SM1_40]
MIGAPMERILVVKLRQMGDTVILTPMLRALRRAHPRARIVVVVPSMWADLLETSPHIDRLIGYRGGSFYGTLALIRELRQERFDLGINPHASSRSAWILFLSAVTQRVVDNRSGRALFSTVNVPHPPRGRAAVERDLDCIRSLGLESDGSNIELFLTTEDRAVARRFLEERGLVDGALRVAIAPGASAPAKQWSAARFASVADILAQDAGVHVLLVGAPEETELLNEVESRMAARPTTVQISQLRHLAAILERCSLFLGNDSGPKHLAVGVGTPTLSIFGPEDAVEWHPYEAEEGHVAIIKDVDCREGGCGKRVCDDHRCMGLITVDEVVGGARTLLRLKKNRDSLTVRGGALW